MRIESIRQWQWMVLSVMIGCGVGSLREQVAEDLAGQYGSEITSQTRFEQSVVNVEQGRHCFTDLSVHTRRVPDRDSGVSKPVCIVSGLYFNGHYEAKDGKLIAAWEPAFFVAPIPYKPAMDVGQLGTSAAIRRLASIKNPTVMDFLDCLGSVGGVRYTRAWWQGMPMWQWAAVSFVTIGMLLPVTINLLVFGSWRRPAEEKGVDLSKVKLPASETAAAPASQEDLDQLIAVTANLENELASAEAGGGVDAAEDSDAPPRELSKATVAPLPVEHSDVMYGAKRDDYYPTAKVGRGQGK